MGTAELACASLEALVASPEFQVVGVVTQPDRPKGRALKLQPPPVKLSATRLGLPVLQPERAREAGFLEQLRRLDPDFIVVAAYGQLLPPAILELPPRGCVNVHASLLPKYRGAAPIQWAILNDEEQTGVTIMKMAEKLDAGDILARRATPIAPDDTSATLHERLARSCWSRRWRIASTIKLPPVLKSRQRRLSRAKLPRKMAGWTGRSPPAACGTTSAPSRRGRGRLLRGRVEGRRGF